MHKIVVGQSLNRRAASAVADSQGHHRKAQAERHEHTLTKNLILRLGYITTEDGLAADPSGDAFERGIEEMWVSGTRGGVVAQNVPGDCSPGRTLNLRRWIS
jgi:hypothetical protein